MGVVGRIVGGSALALAGGLCLWGAWLVADEMLFGERAVAYGPVAETGTERVSAGRGSHERVLLTVEGSPYVFYRRVGWFEGADDLLASVKTGAPATLTVMAEDLADQQDRPPNDRRVPIVALEQDGATVFSETALRLTEIIGILILGAMGGLALLMLALWIRAPEAFAKAAERDKG